MLHTPEDQPQAEQVGGTTATTVGDPELRVMMVPAPSHRNRTTGHDGSISLE
jgi:hypothetical protein